MKNTKDTRERILKAATEVFADDGFRAATVRKICRTAGANVAAVNYHFQGKAGLYEAVIEKLFFSGLRSFPPDQGMEADMAAEEKLRIFIRNFFLRLTGDKMWIQYGSHNRLMLKELSDPTPALDMVVEKYIRPNKEILSEIVRKLLGDAATEENIIRCVLSIMGQCVHYSMARPVIERLARGYEPKKEDIEKITEHIRRFSLGGIRGIKGE